MELREALKLAKIIVSGNAPPQFDELYAALLELKVRFSKPDSWYTRAMARVLLGVRQVGERHWLVPSLPGDSYQLYNVRLTREGKYVCDCYSHLYGHKREKGICTHVASVMIARRWEELKRTLGHGSDELPRDHTNAIPGQRHGHYDQRAFNELSQEPPFQQDATVKGEQS